MQTPFTGTTSALMTPCTPERKPDREDGGRKGRDRVGLGMSAVVYCESR